MPSSEARNDSAERRQLTVLFSDLVGSTQISQELDPEDLRELVLSYQKTAAEVIERYEGHIAQYLGDGLLVYFGHPAAHEDDAERAVRAGYDILAALRRLNAPHPNPLPIEKADGEREPLPPRPAQRGEGGGEGRTLFARIGIHTGHVVIGQMGAGKKAETLAMGDTANLAARIQSLAEPDTVVISQSTLKLVPGLFITKDLGAQQLKGVEKPLQLHQVIQPSGVRTRLEAAEHLTPFVGRQQELALLNDRWQQASEGQGQAVLLTAEPGLGKSRLLLTLREQVQDRAHSWLECRCAPMTQSSPFAPTIELLNRGLQLKEGDSDAVKLQRLELALDAIGQDKQEAVPLLAPLLNLPLPKQYQPSPYGAELKRKKLLGLLVDWTLALAKQQPLLLAFEDLHWSDPSSLDLLALLIEQIPSHQVLVLFTARPEFQPNWPVRAHMAIITLQPLRTKDSGQMLQSLAGNKALPAPVQEKLIERAGGVPLFLEEITKTVLESGQLVEAEGKLELKTKLEDLAIPATLQDSLTARIDKLGEAKPLLQLCAVVGREIPYRLLTHVADTDEATLQSNLKTLTDSQLLYARGSPPDSHYLFKHALIQDSAYHSLLKTTRQKLHGKIAQTLEQHFPERKKNEPAVLAEHFEKAGQIEQAVNYYKLAGEKSESTSAMREALDYAESALRLMPSLPASPSRDVLELTLLNNQLRAGFVVSGYGHPRLRQAACRAGDLLNETLDPILQVGLLGALWVTHQGAGRFDAALAYAQRITVLGQKLKVPVVESVGCAWAAVTLVTMGRFVEAKESAALATSLCDLAGSKLIATQAGADPVTVALIVSGWALFALGLPDQARQRTGAALSQADAVGVPINSCIAVSFATVGRHLFRYGIDQLVAESQSAVALCRRYGYVQGQAWAMRSLGIAQCQLGQPEVGLDLIRQSSSSSEATGWLVDVPLNRLYLAEQCVACGRLAEARAALDEAFQHAIQVNHGWLLAEMYRVNGELLLAEGSVTPAEAGVQRLSQGKALDSGLRRNDEAAETSFHKALEVARGQQAKSYELRAATSLARLWQKQNRFTDTRDLLKPVYDWFTEGFDTPDLKDAKALLDQLR